MAKYPTYTDADFARFEPRTAYDRNAAHKIEEMPPFSHSSAQPQMRVVKQKKKTLAQAKREMRIGALQTAKILCLALCLLALFAGLLYSRLRVDELTREIDKANAQLSVAQGENVRLNMQLDAMISLERVEEHAKNQLGMTKVEGYQIEYVDLSGADTVTVSDAPKFGRLSALDGISEKLREYLKEE